METTTTQDETVICADCGKTVVRPENNFSTGYGTYPDGRKICFACCGERDKKDMRETGRAVLYFTQLDRPLIVNGHKPYGILNGKITNWPGTLEIPCRYKYGRHNIARWRFDVWFTFEGQEWHGVNVGDNQLCKCKRLKSKKRELTGIRGEGI